MIPGAYCQDYETFKNIYRFVERRLRRAKISSYILLLTLTDGNGDFPPLEKRERQMAALRELIQNSLRSGDVFTQYSSCQYLVMVADASAENVEMIAARIREAFYRIIDNGSGQVLLHHCYPMWPAGRPPGRAKWGRRTARNLEMRVQTRPVNFGKEEVLLPAGKGLLSAGNPRASACPKGPVRAAFCRGSSRSAACLTGTRNRAGCSLRPLRT